jgi:hypothetical protein
MKLPKLLAILLLTSSCGAGPHVKICISDPANNAFRCYDSQTQTSSIINFADTENYVCMTPTDAQALLNFCKQKGSN